MTRMQKGLALCLIQVVIVASLGAKLLYDRSTLPRLWVETIPYDPNLPIRGRYVRLQVLVEPIDDLKQQEGARMQAAFLRAQDGRLVAESASKKVDSKTYISFSKTHISFSKRGEETVAVLTEPLAFFLPEGVDDPSRRPDGETLWAEVTVPKTGPPRPIRLGVRKGKGEIEPFFFN
jgi:hypothetical protein